MTRPLALLVTGVTGFTSRVYEVTRQKHRAILLVSHSEATSAVLAIFLGGLVLGYAAFALVNRRMVNAGAPPPVLLRLYGGIEAGIGIHAFAFPLLSSGAQALSLYVPLERESLAFGFDVLFARLFDTAPRRALQDSMLR